MTIDSNAIITGIVAGAGILVSVFTFYYQRKQYRFNTLLEVLKLLNDEKHRMARRVVYDFHKGGINNVGSLRLPDLSVRKDAPPIVIIEECQAIVRNDFNQIGSLINNGLLDKEVFMHTYWYTVLHSWDSLEGVIKEELKIRENPNYMADFRYLTGLAEKYRGLAHERRSWGPT